MASAHENGKDTGTDSSSSPKVCSKDLTTGLCDTQDTETFPGLTCGPNRCIVSTSSPVPQNCSVWLPYFPSTSSNAIQGCSSYKRKARQKSFISSSSSHLPEVSLHARHWNDKCNRLRKEHSITGTCPLIKGCAFSHEKLTSSVISTIYPNF